MISSETDLAKKLVEYYKQEFASRDRLNHVTTLLLCKRRIYYEQTRGRRVDDESVIRFMLGHGHHFLIEEMIAKFPEFQNYQVVTEQRLEVDGITGEPDVVLVEPSGEKILVEVKTTRTARKIADYYVKQMKAYCYMVGTCRAYLIIFRLFNGKFESYEYRFTKEELEEQWNELKNKLNEILECIKQGKPPEPEVGEYCKYCEYRDICRLEYSKELLGLSK